MAKIKPGFHENTGDADLMDYEEGFNIFAEAGKLTFPELYKFDVIPIVWTSVYLGLG